MSVDFVEPVLLNEPHGTIAVVRDGADSAMLHAYVDNPPMYLFSTHIDVLIEAFEDGEWRGLRDEIDRTGVGLVRLQHVLPAAGTAAHPPEDRRPPNRTLPPLDVDEIPF